MSLKFLLLEEVEGWKNCCNFVEEQIHDYDCPISILSFRSLRSIDIYPPQEIDIYIMSYVLSELRKQDRTRRKKIIDFVKCAKRGSKFLFIDYCDNADKNKSLIRTFSEASEIDLSECQCPSSSRTAKGKWYNYCMDGVGVASEETDQLGRIYTEMSKMRKSPQITAKALWCVGSKN